MNMNIPKSAQINKRKYNKLNKQPRPFSNLLKDLIRWLVPIHYNPKAITKPNVQLL